MKQYIQTSSQEPQYDAQTMAFIQSAKQSIAKNHGLALDRDPAEIMKENNRKLHEAAQTLASKRGMVKQQGLVKKPRVETIQPSQMEPVQESPTDSAMNTVGYDQYMQSLMNAPEQPAVERPETEMVELSEMPIQNFTPNVRQPPKTVQFEDAEVQTRQPEHEPTPDVQKPQPRVIAPMAKKQVFARMDVTNYSDVRGLPSEDLLYEAPIMGQALTLMDVLMMNHMDSENVTSTINTLFNRRLIGGWDDGFVADNVLQCDESYLMFWLRASTVDDPLPYVSPILDKWIPYTCPTCGKIATTKEDYQKIQVTFDKMDFKIQGNLREIVAKHANGCHTFYLDDGRQCDVYLRRRYHETKVNEALAQYVRDTGTAMPAEMQVLLHHAVVVEIQGIDNIVDKINYLGNLGYKAAQHFLDEVNNSSLITDITAKVICPFCKKEVTIPYPFRLDAYISSL